VLPVKKIVEFLKTSLTGGLFVLLPLKVSKGKAEVVDTTTNAKLKVWFF
jgi:hypothetical protein